MIPLTAGRCSIIRMGRIWLFLRSMFSEWGSALSGPASVPFAVASLRVGSHVQRILYGSLAAILFFVSAYRTWAREHDAKEKLAKENGELERELNDRRPRIALTTQIVKDFTLVHLGGDAAQHIQVEPIHSVLDKPLWIRFDAVDFLTNERREAFPTFRLDIGGHFKSEGDMGALGVVFFTQDARGRDSVNYSVTISFLWNGRKVQERQTLTFHAATGTLTTSALFSTP